jgi:hypothetical protein
MTLNAVQYHIRGLIDQAPSPFYDPLQAHIMPPVPGDMAQPQGYVWGGRLKLTRQTAPRGRAPSAGFKKRAYLVDIDLRVAESPDDPNADEAFPCLIEVVLGLLEDATMPVKLVDPQTGQTSQLISIGEQIEMAYDGVRTLPDDADQRYVRQMAMLTVLAEEVYQA